MILTRKEKIQPSQSTQQTLWAISDLCNQLWNAAKEQRSNPRSFGKVNGFTQKKELTNIKKAFPEYKLPASQVMQNVVLRLDKAYKSFFSKWANGDKEARPPKFRSRKRFFTQEYSQPYNSFLIENGRLGLAYGKSRKDWLWIDLPGTHYPQANTAEICFDEIARQWYVCLTYDVDDTPLRASGHTLYFDPGSKTALTGIKTTGEMFDYDIQPLRDVNMSTYKRIDELQSVRAKKTKGSYRYRRLNKRIQCLYRKINTRTKTYLHTLANRILGDHPDAKAFLIGNWKKQETLADTGYSFVNRSINRAVQNNHPLQKLIGYLSYKAQMRGQQVDKFDERGSTRTCSQCNHRHKEGVPPNVRQFVCQQCRFTYPRDHHSTLNFIKKFEPALWQCLSANLPDRSVRTTLSPFAFKPQSQHFMLKLAS
jgi:putative transposase